MTMALAPDSLLAAFFEASTAELRALELCGASGGSSSPLKLSECRSALLKVQLSCLAKVVNEYDGEGAEVSTESIQNRLKSLKSEPDLSEKLLEGMRAMEDAARQCLCRLVLYSECLHNASSHPRELQDSGEIERSTLFEFIALNQTAVALPCVLHYLKTGGKIFEDLSDASMQDDHEDKTSTIPILQIQSRIERIQRMMARVNGLEPTLVTTELQRMVQENSDAEFLGHFRTLVAKMRHTVTECRPMDDIADGGVTRVVSVTHKTVEVGTNAKDTDAPREQTMEENRMHQLRMASQATEIQRQILKEILEMSSSDRDATLEEAKQANDDFLALSQAQRLERLQQGTIDEATRRKLLIHTTWIQHLKSSHEVSGIRGKNSNREVQSRID